MIVLQTGCIFAYLILGMQASIFGACPKLSQDKLGGLRHEGHLA